MEIYLTGHGEKDEFGKELTGSTKIPEISSPAEGKSNLPI
jgi:hypothetical protein